MTDPQRTSDIYGILLNRDRPAVLMLSDEAGNWSLPHVHLPDKRIWLAMVGAFTSEMSKQLSAEITVLRNLYADYSDDRTHVELIYELENQTENWSLPPQAQWIDRVSLADLPLTHTNHRAAIEAVLREAETGDIPHLRTPWARPGWYQSASAWMRDQLAQQNIALTSPIEPLKSWGISCILKASTDQGDIFFKVASSLPLFGNEPALLRALSERYPEYVPAPLAVESERRWMLMRDFGVELRAALTPEKWEAAVIRFGQLQLQTVSAIDDLLSVGCLDRRLNILATQIDSLLTDDSLSLLSPDEVARLPSLAPRLKAMCSELAAYNVPNTLNHGDLHIGNITADLLLFFDWTDACIAHPFLDLCTIVADADEVIPGGRERLIDNYLSLWTDYEPMDRLRDMWRLAEPLGALHQAVSYQHILAALEPTSRQEMIWGVPEWVRNMLKAMPQE